MTSSTEMLKIDDFTFSLVNNLQLTLDQREVLDKDGISSHECAVGEWPFKLLLLAYWLIIDMGKCMGN